jgi:hypothetical protein
VINATTQAGAERALQREGVPVRRLGSRLFAAMIGLELLLLIGVLFWALSALTPAQTPLAARQDLAPVREAITAHLSGAVADPLVAVAPGVNARASSLRGFSLNGTTYYYFVEGASNFDPYSRGVVGAEQIEVLLRDQSGPAPLVIYRVR